MCWYQIAADEYVAKRLPNISGNYEQKIKLLFQKLFFIENFRTFLVPESLNIKDWFLKIVRYSKILQSYNFLQNTSYFLQCHDTILGNYTPTILITRGSSKYELCIHLVITLFKNALKACRLQSFILGPLYISCKIKIILFIGTSLF